MKHKINMMLKIVLKYSKWFEPRRMSSHQQQFFTELLSPRQSHSAINCFKIGIYIVHVTFT